MRKEDKLMMKRMSMDRRISLVSFYLKKMEKKRRIGNEGRVVHRGKMIQKRIILKVNKIFCQKIGFILTRGWLVHLQAGLTPLNLT